jgi:hypothetical protein
VTPGPLHKDGPILLPTAGPSRCGGTGRWRVRRSGKSGLFEGPLARVEGQDGLLTESLALRLVDETRGREGPGLALVAGGAEMEDGRQETLRYALGQTSKYTTPWPGVSKRLRLTPEGETAMVGAWLLEDGMETGESVRFERVDGLWKVMNHTLNGKWLALHPAGNGTPRGVVRTDLTLLGVALGSSRTDVLRLLGEPDAESGEPGNRTVEYHLRQMQIRFGADDRVQVVSVRSGGSKSGILIGTPAEVVRLIHGPSSNFVYALREGQALEFKVEGGVVVEIQVH